MRVVRNNLNAIREQQKVDSHYTTITTNNGISVPAMTYGTRDAISGVGGGLQDADYLYGVLSGSYAELEKLSVNEGKVVQIFKRFRIDGDITDGPFTMNEAVQKQGDAAITGVVYGFHSCLLYTSDAADE